MLLMLQTVTLPVTVMKKILQDNNIGIDITLFTTHADFIRNGEALRPPKIERLNLNFGLCCSIYMNVLVSFTCLKHIVQFQNNILCKFNAMHIR